MGAWATADDLRSLKCLEFSRSLEGGTLSHSAEKCAEVVSTNQPSRRQVDVEANVVAGPSSPCRQRPRPHHRIRTWQHSGRSHFLEATNRRPSHDHESRIEITGCWQTMNGHLLANNMFSPIILAAVSAEIGLIITHGNSMLDCWLHRANDFLVIAKIVEFIFEPFERCL